MVIGLLNYRRSARLAGAVDVDAQIDDGSICEAVIIHQADPAAPWGCWSPVDPELSAAIAAAIDPHAAEAAHAG